MVFDPHDSATPVRENVPASVSTVAASPFTVTPATPLVASPRRSLTTVTLDASVFEPSAGEVISIDGLTVSTL
jgi:hypothetical protein